MESRDIVPEDQFTGEDDSGKVWPMGEVKPDFKLYPGKVEFGGHVYCIDLGDGLVKVGRTNSPQARLRTHYVDALRFGITPVRVWISPSHKEFAESERQMLSTLRDEFTSTGPESFRGCGTFERVQQWWRGRTVFPPGQTREERERAEATQGQFAKWLKGTFGGSEPRDPLAGVKSHPGLLHALAMFFTNEPMEDRSFLKQDEWSDESLETARELARVIDEAHTETVSDLDEMTWLDLEEFMAFCAIRTAKWQLELRIRESGHGAVMLERLIDTVPGLDEEVA